MLTRRTLGCVYKTTLARPGLTRASFAALFEREVRMESYLRFATMKRAEYEPQGLQECLEHPPPFSRSFLLVIGGFAAVTVAVGLLTSSPGIAVKMAGYHLRLSTLSLLYFTGEDLAYGVMARTQSWAHRTWPMAAVVVLALAQAGLAADALTDDAFDDTNTAYAKIAVLFGLHTVGSLLIFRLPLWARVWRGVALAGLGVTLPLMYRRRSYAEDHKDLFLF